MPFLFHVFYSPCQAHPSCLINPIIFIKLPRSARQCLCPLGPAICHMRSKAWDCGFEFRRGHEWLSLVSIVCFQVEVCVSSCSLAQRCPTECGVSEYDREALIMRSLWPTRICCVMDKNCHTRCSQTQSTLKIKVCCVVTVA